ncbi:Endonuclease/exonuclease/phosphatase family protein [Rhynchospora pubera]|uniref:Endonuclease/exonuclease/phosphatase family protein n=1 Tax=Rhynchospora pubera TaxID=906938 RepID=A0AAV8DZI1_9POAL|nr:Endonuclease/exonuclease/phosphatase family protein [Rhynchospora pubera]
MSTLARYLHSTKASLGFFCETKCSVQQATRRIRRLPLKNYEIVPSAGLSGGLWLLWDDNLLVSVLERSNFFIFSSIKKHVDDDPWILGAIYGDPNGRVLGYIWDRISFYANSHHIPLCVMGDFNCILHPSEKCGGSSKEKSKNKDFQSMVSRTGLINLGHDGPSYTWCNFQQS